MKRLRLNLQNMFMKKRRVPEAVKPDEYALIKLSRFDDLEVLIMQDKANGGLSVSYDTSAMLPDKQQQINEEIQNIINNQMTEIMEE